MEIDFEMIEMLEFLDNGFIIVIINVFKDLKEIWDLLVNRWKFLVKK